VNEDGIMVLAEAEVISSDAVAVVIPEGVKTEAMFSLSIF